MARCADPVLCYTRQDGKRLFRNFSFVKEHTLILQNAQQVFDCGKCLFCRKKKAYELASRCVLHASLYEDNCFLTLTYDETRKDYDNGFHYVHIQKFKKRLRQFVQRTLGKRIAIFNVHEYGKNGKSHWHLIVFGFYPEDAVLFTKRNGIPYYTSELVTQLWPFGHHTIGDVNEASSMYQAHYMEKDFKHFNVGTKKKAHSKHSGIGRPYFLKHYSQILRLGFVPINGKRLPVPRYFEKLAEKHWAHYYSPSLFHDTNMRKARFRPFKDGEANRDLADHYAQYLIVKEEKKEELAKLWSDTIEQYLTTGKDPDFILSNKNALYDLRQRQTEERF